MINHEKQIKNCFIAYIDILGFSELIGKEEQVNILKKIINDIENIKESAKQEYNVNSKYFLEDGSSKNKILGVQSQIFSISDSIFVTTNLINYDQDDQFEVSDNFSSFQRIQDIVVRIAYMCLLQGLLIRGCIGYSKELLVIGNSLISNVIPDLVKWEKDFSYPRVLMHSSIIDYFSSKNQDLYQSYCTNHLPFRQFFILDFDGLYFLNWAGYFKVVFDNNFYDYGSNPAEGCIPVEPLEKIIEENLSKLYKEKDFKNFSKWFWVKNYFKNMMDYKKSLIPLINQHYKE